MNKDAIEFTTRFLVPQNPDELAKFVETVLNVSVPREPMIASHASPMDFLTHVFFNGRFSKFAQSPAASPADPAQPTSPSIASPLAPPVDPPVDPPVAPPVAPPVDSVVWANRGGGKTFYGAIAAMLDMIHKPKIEIKILAGSLEQATRMLAHLGALSEIDVISEACKPKRTARAIEFVNGAAVEVLAASQTSVRGSRPQVLFCDEVDLFHHDLWDAAQLVVRRRALSGPWGDSVGGAIHALSTMHNPFGIMNSIAARAVPLTGPAPVQPIVTAPGLQAVVAAQRSMPNRTLFRWGVLDVLESCPPEIECGRCAIHSDCQGRAKPRDEVKRRGHFHIRDAQAARVRVSEATWASEMLCLRPRRDGCVYPKFDVQVHVKAWKPRHGAGQPVLVAGMDFGHRSPNAYVLAVLLNPEDRGGAIHVIADHCVSEQAVAWHAERLKHDAARWGGVVEFVGVDPAGNAVNSQTREPDVKVLRDAGFVVRSRRSAIEQGVGLVRRRLEGVPRGVNGAGEALSTGPLLFVDPAAAQTIEALRCYRYAPQTAMGDPDAAKPLKDGHDHLADALRYLVLNLEVVGGVELTQY